MEKTPIQTIIEVIEGSNFNFSCKDIISFLECYLPEEEAFAKDAFEAGSNQSFETYYSKYNSQVNSKTDKI